MSDFVELTEPHRRELYHHCYRMLGSAAEAEDLVQETYLRAWRAYAAFEGRSSVRTWLYRIATRACLDALDGRGRRALPSGLGGPSDADGLDGLGTPLGEPVWLQPVPTGGELGDPAAVALLRARTRLALITALHTLSARERAAVILRDALGWSAAEVAEALSTSVAAVNSALQRARARLAAGPSEDEVVEPDDPAAGAALDRYMTALRTADLDGLVGLLRDDVVLEMPPVPTWFSGRDKVVAFLEGRICRPMGWRLERTEANGHPAAAAWMADEDGVLRPHGVHTLTVTRTGIARITVFRAPDLLERFGFTP
ncbi:RNA polymerase subunit sigma-70 [Dactylosporangium sp. CA-139066]|uniref:RNA polymerase subunit sigma-70 n=1 Tax=Dactylosporangium sp. CA-139066 TaxID=3239930 RepID=UPI003D8A3B83